MVIVSRKAKVSLAEKSYVTRRIKQAIEANHWEEVFYITVE